MLTRLTRGSTPLLGGITLVVTAFASGAVQAQLKPAAPPAPKEWKAGAEATASASGAVTLTRDFVWGEKLEPASGSFKLSAVDNTWGEDLASKDQLADCEAEVKAPKEKAAFTIKITKLRPVGEKRPTMGGVMMNGDLFGNSELGGPGLFPRLHAYVAVWGLATVSKNGKVIGKDRPALAWVGQAARDPQGKWLYTADQKRITAHIVVFGSLGGPGPLPGTPDGFLHATWDNVRLTAPGFTAEGRTATASPAH